MWCLEEEIAGRRLGRSAPNDCGRLGNEEAALSVAPRGESIYALEVLEVFALEHRGKNENLEKFEEKSKGSQEERNLFKFKKKTLELGIGLCRKALRKEL